MRQCPKEAHGIRWIPADDEGKERRYVEQEAKRRGRENKKRNKQ
jgi:hypothetical protein